MHSSSRLKAPWSIADRINVAMSMLTVLLVIVGFWNILLVRRQLAEERQSHTLESRAWVAIRETQFGASPDNANIQRAFGTVEITNTGSTPALRVLVDRCVKVDVHEPNLSALANPSSVVDPSRCQSRNIGLIGRDVHVPMTMADHITDVGSGLKDPNYFFYWGKITYHTLPDGAEHHTSFCLFGVGKVLSPCSKGNDAD